MTHNAVGIGLVLALAGLVGLLAYGAFGRSAAADDPAHSTLLQLIPDYYGDGIPQVVATFVSADPQDDTVRIGLQWFDSGNPANSASETTTKRWSSTNNVDAQIVIDAREFPQANVRAVFEARDSSGNLRFAYVRSIATP